MLGTAALLAKALATGFGLYVLITVLGPVSGAHFNPLVTGWACIACELSPRRAGAYVAAQVSGAVAGGRGAYIAAAYWFTSPTSFAGSLR